MIFIALDTVNELIGNQKVVLELSLKDQTAEGFYWQNNAEYRIGEFVSQRGVQ